jgi:hypothetical protein
MVLNVKQATASLHTRWYVGVVSRLDCDAIESSFGGTRDVASQAM